jgi:hypothetical protein
MQAKIENTGPSPKPGNSMTSCSKLSFIFGATLVATLTGCVGYVEHRHHAEVYAPPPPVVYVEPAVVVQDDYIYYPSYQVYYSSSRRSYIYLDGRSWVTRPSPPRVSVDVLFASPSVHLDFHDAPSSHHSRVVQQYPKHWSPPGHNKNKDKDDDGGNGHGNNGKGHK